MTLSGLPWASMDWGIFPVQALARYGLGIKVRLGPSDGGGEGYLVSPQLEVYQGSKVGCLRLGEVQVPRFFMNTVLFSL